MNSTGAENIKVWTSAKLERSFLGNRLHTRNFKNIAIRFSRKKNRTLEYILIKASTYMHFKFFVNI